MLPRSCPPNIHSANQIDYEHSVGTALVNTDLTYISVNETLARFHCNSVDQYKGRYISELIPTPIYAVVAPLYAYVINTGLPIELIRFSVRDAEDSYKKISWQAGYIRVEEGVMVTVSQSQSIPIDTDQELGEKKPITLTSTEKEVSQFLSLGCSSKEIATGLHISTFTVNTHRKHICNKLDIHSTSELIAWAVKSNSRLM